MYILYCNNKIVAGYEYAADAYCWAWAYSRRGRVPIEDYSVACNLARKADHIARG